MSGQQVSTEEDGIMKLGVCGSIMRSVMLCALCYAIAGEEDARANSEVVPSIEQFRLHPLAFTENSGQWSSNVFYRATAGGPALWFTQEGITYQFSRSLNENSEGSTDPLDQLPKESKIEQLLVSSRFVGANPDVTACGENLMEYKCNYFIGNDPSLWRTDVPNYQSILLKNVYDGIDVRFYGNEESVEYDFIVAPGADPSLIQMEFDSIRGLSIDDHGNLVVETTWGTMRQLKPVIFQQENGWRENVEGRFLIKDSHRVGFEIVDEYDPKFALLIDPVLTFSTYLGGADVDTPHDVAVNASGQVFMCGETASSPFPLVNPYDNTIGGPTDAFVTKFNAAGNSLSYSTYIGGSSTEVARALSLIGDVAYIAGSTTSSNYPTVDGFDGSLGGTSDGFVSVLGAVGNTLGFSTYIGGEGAETVYDIVAMCPSPCVFANYKVWITGSTSSTAFPVVNAYDATANGGIDVFLVQYNLTTLGNSIGYSTFFGGSGGDVPNGLAVYNATNPHITGQTSSANFPMANPYDASLAGPDDAFITSFGVAGNGSIFPTFSTYFGGTEDIGSFFEQGNAILVRASGNIVVAGETVATGLATTGAYDTSPNGGPDIFVAEFNPNTPSLVFCTYLGGSGSETASLGPNIVTDASQDLFVTGQTSSTDFPVANAYDGTLGGANDVFVSKLSSNGSSLLFSSYLGGSGDEVRPSIAQDISGCTYVVGVTGSANFPVVGPYDGSLGGTTDAFLTKICIPLYTCGDADGSGSVTISDAVYLINYIFGGGPAPNPVLSGDADCSGTVTISDAVYLINYIFAGGMAPCAACP